MNYAYGDVLKGKGIICQSVNHMGVMGSGLAKQIRSECPGVFSDYSSMCKLFSFEQIKRNGLVSFYSLPDGRIIASIFGQQDFGREPNTCYTDYVSLGNGLESVRLLAEQKEMDVSIPYGIGCGLGGGDWKIVRDIISRCFSNSPNIRVTIYMLNYITTNGINNEN